MAWLGEPLPAFASVVAVDVWRGVPFVMLLMLAGLQTIPREQYEAAAMDGANAWQRFRYVTLPNLRYLLVVASTLDIINTVRHYDIIGVMTAGGPAGATEVLPVAALQHGVPRQPVRRSGRDRRAAAADRARVLASSTSASRGPSRGGPDDAARARRRLARVDGRPRRRSPS